MQNHMEILQKQISLFTEDNATYLQEDSHASHIHRPEKDLEKKMTATSGRKCLEQFEKFNQIGLWAKTYAALLIGMEGWYSTKCRLTWKLKATKSSRFYFQLVPSTLPTDGIGFGLLLLNNQDEPIEEKVKRFQQKGLLPTPRACESIERRNMKTIVDKVENGGDVTLTTLAKYKGGVLLPTPTAHQQNTQFQQGGTCLQAHFNKLLPTPTAMDSTGATANMKSTQVKPGSMHSMTLSRLLLPTPTAASDAKGGCTRPDVKRQNDTLAHAMHAATNGEIGTTSQLNPRFVAEMMGFPPNWLELPFQNTEMNQ